MAHRRARALTTLAAGLWLSACQQPAAVPYAPTAPAPAAQSDPTPAKAVQAVPASATVPVVPVLPPAAPAAYAITIKGRIHADLPESTFTLLAQEAPQNTQVLHVRSIDIRRAGAAAPVQRIDGLATDTPWSALAPGLELLDMNFDGYTDMRLIASQPAGPNLPYLNWLYDPASGQFVDSPALDAITAPQFDAVARVVHSQWRDGASRYGTDTYMFRDGSLVPLRREEKYYQRAGVFTLTTSRWADGVWRLIETREGRDP